MPVVRSNGVWHRQTGSVRVRESYVEHDNSADKGTQLFQVDDARVRLKELLRQESLRSSTAPSIQEKKKNFSEAETNSVCQIVSHLTRNKLYTPSILAFLE